MKLAYTMGNKNSYDYGLVEDNDLGKLGRCTDNGRYYAGGCCWKTYSEAKLYVEKHEPEMPYKPGIYGILLPNSWEQDTSDDTYDKEGFYSLLVDSKIVGVDSNGKIKV